MSNTDAERRTQSEPSTGIMVAGVLATFSELLWTRVTQSGADLPISASSVVFLMWLLLDPMPPYNLSDRLRLRSQRLLNADEKVADNGLIIAKILDLVPRVEDCAIEIQRLGRPELLAKLPK